MRTDNFLHPMHCSPRVVHVTLSVHRHENNMIYCFENRLKLDLEQLPRSVKTRLILPAALRLATASAVPQRGAQSLSGIIYWLIGRQALVPEGFEAECQRTHHIGAEIQSHASCDKCRQVIRFALGSLDGSDTALRVRARERDL